MKIVVTRSPSDKQGPDVVDAILTTEVAGIARGQREIDFHSSNRTIERGNCPLLDYLATGSLVNVTKSTRTYRGKLKTWATKIDIDQEKYTAITSISIERET